MADISRLSPAQQGILSLIKADVRLIRPAGVRGWVNEWGEMIYRANDPSILKPIQQGRELTYEILKKMGAREVLGMDRPARVFTVEKYVGACQPGADPRTSVVDGHFESHDVPGLFVCDGSTVPLGASEGYAGSVGTVAVYASDRIVERHFTRG
jgi:choline dehydrogenase-like flavoprotein